MKRLSVGELLVLNAYWIGLSFKWNSLHVIILPAVLLHYVPENLKNTYLGLLTFVGLIVAMILQPITGALSDRRVSRWGKRHPFILIGTLFDFVFLAVLAWAGGLLWLGLGYLGLQLSSNLAHGPAQGLIPDHAPREQHGAASGIKNLMDMGGLVVASLVMGNLMDPNSARATIPIAVVAGVVLVSMLVTLIGVKGVAGAQAAQKTGETEEIDKPSMLNSLRIVSRPYWWLIAARFVFLLGIFDIQVFAQYYIRDVLQTSNPVKLTGDLLASISIALIVFAVAGGWLGDRVGHRRISYFACGLGAVGCLLLVAARSANLLLVFGGILGVGIGLFLTSNWALANTLAPAEQAGFYLGLTNLATAGAGATGRLGGPIIDLLNNAAPGANLGYFGMFVFGALCSLLSALVLRRVKL